MKLRILLPIVFAGLASCNGDQGPDPTWLVTTALGADQFSAGERLAITVVAHNISSEVHHIDNVCAPQFRLLESSGLPRALPFRVCTQLFITPRDVAPGDSIVVHDSWAGDISGGYVRSVPAPPGLYLIEGRVFGPNEVIGTARSVLLTYSP